jgi:hypothetical protein
MSKQQRAWCWRPNNMAQAPHSLHQLVHEQGWLRQRSLQKLRAELL